MRRRALFLLLGFLAVAAVAGAQVSGQVPGHVSNQASGQAPGPASGPVSGQDGHRQVSDVRVLTVTGHCFYGPNIDKAQAEKLCRAQVRATLLDQAVSGFGAEPGVRGSGLSGKGLRAFVDSRLTVDPLEEESRKVPDGLAVRLNLRGELRLDKLTEQVAAFLVDDQARAKALAETAHRDRLAAEARMAAIPFEAEREFARPPAGETMRADTALATRRLVRGMSLASVKGLLGNPAAYRQSVIDADTYVCAAYDTIWVVLRDGAVACARTRLEYMGRFGTDCHCFGDARSVLPLN